MIYPCHPHQATRKIQHHISLFHNTTHITANNTTNLTKMALFCHI
jgi:hypothetical protein